MKKGRIVPNRHQIYNMKFLLPILLGILGVGLFVIFTNSAYTEVKILRAEVDSYDQALNNSRQLQEVRDALGNRYKAFSKNDTDRLIKMVPDNVDNIRLIIDISQIAKRYGLILKNVKYDTSAGKSTTGKDGALTQSDRKALLENKVYGSFDLEFSTQGQYGNFLAFLRDMEQNLRIVDIVGLSFNPAEADSATVFKDNYKYDFKIRTYYLKN